MAGEEAERLLAARAPGYLPLRAGVPVPVGVRPADNVRSPVLDWDRLAGAKRRLAPVLESWPAP
jgi:iron(III) transport system substrate-binding protein